MDYMIISWIDEQEISETYADYDDAMKDMRQLSAIMEDAKGRYQAQSLLLGAKPPAMTKKEEHRMYSLVKKENNGENKLIHYITANYTGLLPSQE